MNESNTAEKIKLIIAMLIVGSIGIFVKNVPLPRAAIAFSRALIGTLVILPAFIARKSRANFTGFKKNLVYLILSGAALGFNWMLLFEAYNYTSVQVATLCYYMAPVFVIIVSPFILKEKMTVSGFICTLCAVLGAVMISGVLGGKIAGVTGILFGLSAAVLYALIIILNKKISGISGIERTFYQLFISAVVMFVYVMFTEDVLNFRLNGTQLATLLIVGIVHTGVVYILFFTSISKLSARSASVLSYIDPVAAIIFSAALLNEHMDVFQNVGMILIIGSACAGELVALRKK